ncbi:MAG: nucleotidyltransferase domain-containing protein [Nitrospirota bacterium]
MNDFMTYKITPEEKEKIISAFKDRLEKYNEIIFAYIFGSFIDNEMPFFRDIDIGVYVNEDVVLQKQFLDYAMNLSLELESLFKRYPVDAVVMNNAPLSLISKITQGEMLFVRDEDLWGDFVTKAWSLYHDHAISSREILKDMVSA